MGSDKKVKSNDNAELRKVTSLDAKAHMSGKSRPPLSREGASGCCLLFTWMFSAMGVTSEVERPKMIEKYAISQ